jgi:phage FluMu protein Com
MIDVKCKNCNRLLAKAESMNAAIKCPRCKMIFEYKIYSNLFVTNAYDPKLHLRIKNSSANIDTESSETIPD